ncbi:MarR family winged helix-turn-helix transcriptional regulator [Streptomyces sp. SP18BB07]|uniref:MarR family winged helix-turn-helix transcriptional regulator n=1 Tax=Streptomyces sp. SP18BB07 TaxID=3002522 RepID=UPI002E7A160C|nr:MarR family winged helix-turn-helix transcriptional regulator [Streptomyces sp. SP18BB07]MEE1757841.1 MarR family winged helix-turn-helix transcriptional regulator [Streptomyces sp. SP18BB07]
MSEAPLVPGTVAEHTICLLVKLGQVAFRIAEDGISGTGLRVRHYSVLQALADNGAMPQLTLGSFLRIDPATMVTSLDDLERAGYAERTRDPQDRRRYAVDITDNGRKVLADLNNTLADLDTETLTDLDSTERHSLHTLLVSLAESPALTSMFDAVREQSGTKRA